MFSFPQTHTLSRSSLRPGGWLSNIRLKRQTAAQQQILLPGVFVFDLHVVAAHGEPTDRTQNRIVSHVFTTLQETWFCSSAWICNKIQPFALQSKLKNLVAAHIIIFCVKSHKTRGQTYRLHVLLSYFIDYSGEVNQNLFGTCWYFHFTLMEKPYDLWPQSTPQRRKINCVKLYILNTLSAA